MCPCIGVCLVADDRLLQGTCRTKHIGTRDDAKASSVLALTATLILVAAALSSASPTAPQ